MRRTSILHVFISPLGPDTPAVAELRDCPLLWTSVFLSRTSEIRHRVAPGVAQNLAIVTTQTVSGSWPDLPKYPSHTPNDPQGAHCGASTTADSR